MSLENLTESLERDLVRAERTLERRKGELRQLALAGQSAAREERESRELQSLMDEACTVLQKFSDSEQQTIRAKLEGLVTLGLQTIFEDDLRLLLRTKQVGRRTDTEFVIASTIDGSEVETSIMDARGGGVAAVTGFLLQVVLLLLHGSEKVMFLDETFAQVSDEYLPRLASFVSDLADRLRIQFVIVTHSDVFEDPSDAVYRTKTVSGATQFTRVK